MHLELGPDSPLAPEVTFEDFLALDIRVGTVVEAEPFPEARKPSLKLHVDFGPVVGVRRSSAQIASYPPETLIGRQVTAVVNFPPRQVGPVRSEVLILGFPSAEGEIVLSGPDRVVPNGTRMT